MDQYVNLTANRNSRRLQLAERGCDPSISQVVTWVIFKPDDQNTGVVASGSDDQVMEVFEVFGILRQNRETFDDRVDHQPRIGGG
jgi:hypothetical protein